MTTTLVVALTLALVVGHAALGVDVCGDCAHDDANPTVIDALVAAQTAASLQPPGPGLIECDVNADTDVDILDALAIAQFGAGLPVTLSCFSCGDCSPGGGTNVTDADVAMVRSLQGATVGSNSMLTACDIDGDGMILPRDVAVLNGLVGSPLISVPCTQCGDCNQDRMVMSDDAVRALSPILPTTRAFGACDVEPAGAPNGAVNSLDALFIGQFAANMRPNLTCAQGVPPQARLAPAMGAFCVLGDGVGTPWTATIRDLATGAVEGVSSPGVVGPPGVVAAEWRRIIDATPTLFTAITVSPPGCFIVAYKASPTTPPVPLTMPTITIGGSGCVVPGGAPCAFNPDLVFEPLGGDTDDDGIDDVEELLGGTDPGNDDTDSDGSLDGDDNCPKVANEGQKDTDSDGLGDACEHTNRHPVAVADYAVTDEGVPVTIEFATNDFDRDGNLDPETIVVVQQPPAGTLTNSGGGSLLYQPPAGFSGNATGLYKICDSNGACAAAEVTIAVLPGADNPPEATDDEATVNAGSGVAINVLANDFDLDDDLDPESVTIEVAPKRGQAFAVGGGIVKYVPDPNFEGEDTLTYEVCDTAGLCDTAMVLILVIGDG